MMKLEQLRVFLSVVEHGSFSRAAEDLSVSQSTVSFHVAGLETATHAHLLDRGRGQVRVTSQGKLLERYARRIVALTAEAQLSLRQAEQVPTGHVEVGTSTIVAEHFMPPILRAFRKLCPNVSVRVGVSDSREALEGLISQRCELALIGAPAQDRRFESVPFAHDDIVLVGLPGGPRKLDCATELSDLPLILREPGSGTRTAVRDLLAEARLDRADIVVVGSTEAARRSVLAGLGYSFISRRAIDDDVRARRMRVVKTDGTPVCRWFHVVRLRTRTPSPAAQALRDLIVGQASASAG